MNLYICGAHSSGLGPSFELQGNLEANRFRYSFEQLIYSIILFLRRKADAAIFLG